MRVACVLRAGREFQPKHVRVLQHMVATHLPDAEFVCLSDTLMRGTNTISLKHDWPIWFAKMELYRPDIKDDLLVLDLDTVVLGDLSDIASVVTLTVLRDFYRDGTRRPVGLGSGIMYLPEEARAEVWEKWMENPKQNIIRLRMEGLGDQAFLEPLWLGKADYWQDQVPGQVVSWKVHCKDGIPKDANVICFHGKPRPWATDTFRKLYE